MNIPINTTMNLVIIPIFIRFFPLIIRNSFFGEKSTLNGGVARKIHYKWRFYDVFYGKIHQKRMFSKIENSSRSAPAA